MRKTTFAAWLIAALFLVPALALGQTRIMPLGDSITQGGNNFASYRYPLWFQLVNNAHDVDFVGSRTVVHGTDPPNPANYPNYLSTFDRNHEGYWGYRTDELAPLVSDMLSQAQPDIVLLHAGTNDLGQLGPSGLTNADTYLRQMIATIRAQNASMIILIAKIIPIGAGSAYGANANLVGPLNGIISEIVDDLYTTTSPILIVDQNTDYNASTMLQPDGLHPNSTGEIFMAGKWFGVLNAVLSGVPPLVIDITNPAPGTEYVMPGDITINADVFDPNNFIVRMGFFTNNALIASDLKAPFSATWTGAAPGNYRIRVEGFDTVGMSRASTSIPVTVLPDGTGTPIEIANASFEETVLGDSLFAEGPGDFGGWIFYGTDSTSVGILNPSSGSYPGADSSASPPGADSSNVAFLTNWGGLTDSVSISQTLGDTLALDTSYVLSVALGRFMPDQPLPYAGYGGYRVSLLAGNTVIGTTTDVLDPGSGEFQEIVLLVDRSAVNAGAVGDTLGIRITLSDKGTARSTHFDDVRLVRYDPPAVVGVGPSMATQPLRFRVSPNPVRHTARVRYELREPARVSVSLFDVAGRRVRELQPLSHRPAGAHATPLGGRLSAGVYFVRLSVDGVAASQKVIVAGD